MSTSSPPIISRQAQAQTGQPLMLAIAWAATLLVSGLPDIFWRELSGSIPSWLFWAKIALLVVLLAVSFLWSPIRPLRPYFAVFAILYLAEWGFAQLGESFGWQNRFGGAGISFTMEMLGVQLLRLGVAVVMVAALWLIKKRRSAFFLVKGETAAPAESIRWLGMRRPESWTRFGITLSLFISLGTLAFLVIAGRPTLGILARALPLLPAVLLFAVMNAFSEEMNYRASFLATLPAGFPKGQALLITAAFFGIGHFYGVPYGVIGVLMAGFLGWLLGKSMLETRGLFWAWFIHFLQDVMIFSFMAIGSITAGGA